LTGRIPKKNRRDGTRSKFMSNADIGSISQTTEDMKMRKGRWFGKEKFKRGFEGEDRRWEAIDDVSSSKGTFPPKLGGEVSLKS
jgi:hypothetical protein